ncbi:FRG domain-containing protein [Clostridioides sp. ES-S-0010-02]|uniref:FRG domain-containing protein n=1 Tax=Clostridioides sp. ES-S-0010-02 TaxID=2770776 RepID=UPI001D0F9F24|nr:FRG domain-containing protein [Clostridioides sp. ES-S-0010-02]
MRFIDNLDDILKYISVFKKESGIVWFRVHNNINYRLNGGLYRIDKNLSIIRDSENNIFNYFINCEDSYYNQFYENKDWDVLFLMKHCNLPTRFLYLDR